MKRTRRHVDELEVLSPSARVLVVGKTGTGKSEYVKTHLVRELEAGTRILVADYHDEYSERGRRCEYTSLGPIPFRLSYRDLLAHPEVLEEEDLALAVPLLDDPLSADNSLAADRFEELCALSRRYGDMLLVADECGEYLPECLETARTMATQARHQGVRLLWASQRMVDFHPRVRSQASHLVAHRQSLPADLDALEELTGSKDFASGVSRLPDGHHLVWRDLTPTEAKEVRT